MISPGSPAIFFASRSKKQDIPTRPRTGGPLLPRHTVEPRGGAVATGDGTPGIEVNCELTIRSKFPAKFINNCHETSPRWLPCKSNIESTTPAAVFQGVVPRRGFRTRAADFPGRGYRDGRAAAGRIGTKRAPSSKRLRHCFVGKGLMRRQRKRATDGTQMKHGLKTEIRSYCSYPCLIRAYLWLFSLPLCVRPFSFRSGFART